MKSPVDDVLGRGVYGASEALRLINFRRRYEASTRSISRQTIARWLRGYDYHSRDGAAHHSDPLWRPDYVNEDETIELSFRDLIELRFVKAFRDVGLSLPTIRECFMRAVEAVNDQRPFSTQRFRTDGKTIFLEITHDVHEGELLDLKRRQGAFHRIVAPSLHDLEFDAEIVARCFRWGCRARRLSLIRRAPSDDRSCPKAASPSKSYLRRSRLRALRRRWPSSMKSRSRRCVMLLCFSSSSPLETAARS
jgi:hypothetical protein